MKVFECYEESYGRHRFFFWKLLTLIFENSYQLISHLTYLTQPFNKNNNENGANKILFSFLMPNFLLWFSSTNNDGLLCEDNRTTTHNKHLGLKCQLFRSYKTEQPTRRTPPWHQPPWNKNRNAHKHEETAHLDREKRRTPTPQCPNQKRQKTGGK